MQSSYVEMAQDLACKAFGSNEINLDETERIFSAIGGGAVLLTSANLRSLRGLLATVIGGSLVYRGLTGHCPFYSAVGFKTSDKSAAAKGRSSSTSGSRERANVAAD